MTKPLRFAPLIRVSTESQEKQGESLRTQRNQITQYVQTLGGTIPERCWDYCGQEHATPGQERQKLDKLLRDASKGVFDAVIVCDASRWSRDNRKSKEGLEVLRQHNIRFFVATMEYSLHAPEHTLFLGMSTEINEFHARMQSLKSLTNRIERAKRGYPTCGKLPYGRTFDRKTKTWGLDEEKLKNIRYAADQYLNHGKSIKKDLAAILGVNHTNLWFVLNHRCGDSWEVQFQSKELNIDETVTITVPRLLPQETIDAIHNQAAANKTYNHGEIKNRYLLSSLVFCAECGYAMTGQTNHGNRSYYRHARERKETCYTRPWIRADELEKAVLVHLFGLFGDVAAMERAITRAIPDHDKLATLREEKSALQDKLAATQREKQNLVRAIAKGTLLDDEAGAAMQDLRKREALLTSEIDRITPQLENLPTKKQIRRRARLVQKVLESVYSRDFALAKMTYEDKQKLVKQALGGYDAEGRRLGVYMRRTGDKDRPWTFTIRGIVAEPLEGQLPMQAIEAEELLGVDNVTKFGWP